MASGIWALLDQGLSSATNLALALAVAQVSDPAELGAYGLAFGGYLFALALARGLVTTPLMIRYGAKSEAQQKSTDSAVQGLTLVVALFSALVLVGVGLALSNEIRAYFLVTAISMPGLLLQDSWRFQMYVRSKPAFASLIDGVWALGQSIAFAGLLIAGVSHGPIFVSAWGGAAFLSAVVLLKWNSCVPSLNLGWQFLCNNRNLAANIAGERAVGLASITFTPAALAGVVGLAGVGGMRAAEILLGAANIPMHGLTPIITRFAVRRHHLGGSLARPLSGATVGGCVLILIYGFLLSELPRQWGRAAVGASWDLAQGILLAVTVLFIARWATTGAFIGMRARGQAPRTLVLRGITSVLVFAAAVVGAVLGGIEGATWGMAAAGLAGASAAWMTFVFWPRGGLERSELGCDRPESLREAGASAPPGLTSKLGGNS